MRWDAGVRWHVDTVTPTVLQPVTLTFVRDEHLRAMNESAEDVYLQALIGTATRMAERVTQRALLTQTLRLVLDRFPCGEIALPCPPLQAVTSIDYIDPAGDTQTLPGGSPEAFHVIAPTGPSAAPALLTPLYGETWPTTRAQRDAVRVTYTAGYTAVTLPDDIRHGILLVIGELYKQRSESVHTLGQTPALIRARTLWRGYRVF